MKTDCMCIIVLFEDLFDVSVVLLQSAFETTSPFTDASRPQDFLLYTSLQIKSLSSNVCFAVVQCASRLWVATIFPSFDILLQLIFIGSLSRLVLLNILY